MYLLTYSNSAVSSADNVQEVRHVLRSSHAWPRLACHAERINDRKATVRSTDCWLHRPCEVVGQDGWSADVRVVTSRTIRVTMITVNSTTRHTTAPPSIHRFFARTACRRLSHSHLCHIFTSYQYHKLCKKASVKTTRHWKTVWIIVDSGARLEMYALWLDMNEQLQSNLQKNGIFFLFCSSDGNDHLQLWVLARVGPTNLPFPGWSVRHWTVHVYLVNGVWI